MSNITRTTRVVRGCIGLMIMLTLSAAVQAQSTLQITAPTGGTIANPGQSITVNVSASGGPFTQVGIIAPGVVSGNQVLTVPPYQFSFTIPSIPAQIRPGLYSLGAVGSTSSGSTIFSDPVSIDIERSDSPQSVAVDHPQLRLRIGDGRPIHLFGKYEDGSIVDLSQSPRTKYAPTVKAVVSVTSEGFITALGIGSTTIVIRHGDRQATATVVVNE